MLTLSKTRTLVPAALLLCLAACNRNRNSSTEISVGVSSKGSSVGNACALVTTAEASTTLGTAVNSYPIHAQLLGSDMCDYAVGPGDPVKWVDITISPLKSAYYPSEDQSWEGEKSTHEYGKLQPLAGLGEDAFFADDNRLDDRKIVEIRKLFVRTKHRILSIEVRGLKDISAEQDAEKKLAQTAISRL